MQCYFFARMLQAVQVSFGRGQLYRGIYFWSKRGVFWLEEKFFLTEPTVMLKWMTASDVCVLYFDWMVPHPPPTCKPTFYDAIHYFSMITAPVSQILDEFTQVF